MYIIIGNDSLKTRKFKCIYLYIKKSVVIKIYVNTY